MKFLPLICLLALVFSTGCARRYVITMNNGTQITSANRPTREGGVYVFKDIYGQGSYIPAGRVKEIAPESMSREKSSSFQFNPGAN